MKNDLEEHKQIEEELRCNLEALRKQSNANKRERDVLAHQSTLILQGLTENSEGNDCMILLQEIEDLKRALEDDRNKHEDEINLLQEQLEDQETNAQIEILEERLKLAEAELQAAIERADKAEEKLRAPPIPPPLLLRPFYPLHITRQSSHLGEEEAK
ncbi:hypothetical protein NQ317_013057 [Molorchus minor]|uniref:Uncharacterized protein n=1 Tax=Molorchus minor TaxID=1323400 RepID=A0ABQ9K2K1_9CUCU|nr:hypothetical protein NQ317_013057 [Molorchus minor]